jgi:hypothetical protein
MALSALGAFETPVEDVPAERAVVDPAEDDALVDEFPVPPLVVVETASCAGANGAPAAKTIDIIDGISVRLIVPAAPFEPRLEQETSNRIVIEVRSNFPWARSRSSLLFLCRAISSGELGITRSTMSILDPEPTLPGTSILPR